MVIDALKPVMCIWNFGVLVQKNDFLCYLVTDFHLQIVKFNTLVNINGIQTIHV